MDTPSRLRYAIKVVLSRNPSAKEQAILTAVLEDVRRSYAGDAAATAKVLKLGRAPVAAGASTDELAAWTGVANVILNLDETVTKE